VASVRLGSGLSFVKQLNAPAAYPSELLDATKCAKITPVLRHDYPGQVCSIANSLEVIGERWSLLIVRDVLNGNRRFGELQSSLGIARNVLSARLQRLVDEDILERRLYQENPARYEYFLTEKGLALWPALIALLNWGDRYSSGSAGPPKIILHKVCGGRVSDRGICEECGQTLTARDAIQVPGPGRTAALAAAGTGGSAY
jgi:DNA-binding HxlR family transcriptional regulator